MLLQFTPNLCAVLAMEAHKELRADAAARLYHNAGTGKRDFAEAVKGFDDLWRNQFENHGISTANTRQQGVRAENAAIVEDEAFAASDSTAKRLPLWISTKLNVADIFTKALDSTTFYKFRAALLNISYEHLPMELSDKIHVA